MNFLITILFVCISAACNPQGAGDVKSLIPEVSTSTHQLGNTTITVKTYQYGKKSGPFFLSLHDDESTGVEAAMNILEETGGRLVRIENNSERLIEFSMDGKNYKADPNRIFSKDGIESNLKRLNQKYSASAVNELRVFAGFMLGKLPVDSQAVIAIHNNDNEGGLTIKSYMRGGEYEKDVRDIHVNKDMNPDNFYITTDDNIHENLKSLGYNSVLQHNSRAYDDGSLSVYYGRKGKKYVNIEAEQGKTEQQEEMIRTLLKFTK